MKIVSCKNNKSDSKYFKGKVCHEEILVEDSVVSALCWKCSAQLVPVEEKKPLHPDYPRGWALLKQFVDAEGNVYHKGVLQKDLFGKFPPTDLQKKTSTKKKSSQKKDTLDDKILEEYSMRLQMAKKREQEKKEKRKQSSQRPRVAKIIPRVVDKLSVYEVSV